MEIIVAVKQVPDLIEELEINEDGTGLDPDLLSFVLNEFDDHALEEALLLKEEVGGSVTVIGVDTTDELDQALYTAIAKGADRAVKLVGDFDEEGLSSHAMARLLADAIGGMSYDLILVGVQAADDLDGQVAPMLAAYLGLPHVGVVTGVQVQDGTATVHKEFWGGIMAELEVTLPAVLGIQAARQPPRYAPVSRVRQAMKSATIEEIEVDEVPQVPVAPVRRMFKPEATGRAEIIEGDEATIAERIVEILKERGVM
ncbi:MAG: electron transfer flavoprotein subunit beta/FixA family protein [Chloroflexi bacterium]|nr:MAG: electron transfer flavoprotein subunit beta/FixA family protein [Chloroflexota bacterium]